MHNPKHGSGQYILIEAVQTLDALRSRGWEVQFRWIPAHNRILGNELANEVPKVAAGYRPDAQTEPVLVATAKSTIRRAMKSDWAKSWEADKHGRELFQLGVRPGQKLLKTHKGTHRAINSVITQMRTGKIRLRAYLYAINKPTLTSANADTDVRRCDISSWNAETGRRSEIECGQAKIYRWILSAFSVARQWQYKQQR